MIRSLLAASCVALLTAASAHAGEASGASAAAPRLTQPSQRAVMVCASDAATVRGFRRDHGARPVFVSADQVMASRGSGDRWDAPRCMSAREHARLVRLMSTRAGR